ncbi:unnamed protein product [Thelazia callipaeda]|uniref:G_PROTEIN_RECEP_F1_2 domain-containing protein n=1 Tax=Thelazia callipaeda TaxID=103827 RepID=A0A0N5D6T6_THECL|nr:unnamed protein product [Thelazia callipaeda]
MNATLQSSELLTQNSFSACTNGTTEASDCYNNPPHHLFSDYVEMAYLFLVIIISTPANAHILYKLLQSRKNVKSDNIKAGFLLLKINLNISDLLLLILLAAGKFFWLMTYSWLGGDILCKVFNFLSMIALYISSNIVVCIAFDRFRNVLHAAKIKRNTSLTNEAFLKHTVYTMITISWLLAIIWSIPQLWVWKTLNVYPDYPGGWVQCSDIWSIEKFEAMRNGKVFDNSKELAKNLYDISHLARISNFNFQKIKVLDTNRILQFVILVFWGPLLLLVISYAFIAIRLIQYSKENPSISGHYTASHMEDYDVARKQEYEHGFIDANSKSLTVMNNPPSASNSVICTNGNNFPPSGKFADNILIKFMKK